MKRNMSLGSNRIVVLLTALLVAVGLTGLTTTAIAGAGQGGGQGGTGHKHHHKHHKCPKGTHKKFVFKHGKRKKKCVPNDQNTPGSPSPTSAGLVINPSTIAFPDTQHHTGSCPACPTQDFTVKNAGGKASGALTASVTDVTDPNPGDDPAFSITQNGCSAALPPGKTCSLTVMFEPPSNALDGNYASVLHVAGSPGGDAKAQMSGHGE